MSARLAALACQGRLRCGGAALIGELLAILSPIVQARVAEVYPLRRADVSSGRQRRGRRRTKARWRRLQVPGCV